MKTYGYSHTKSRQSKLVLNMIVKAYRRKRGIKYDSKRTILAKGTYLTI